MEKTKTMTSEAWVDMAMEYRKLNRLKAIAKRRGNLASYYKCVDEMRTIRNRSDLNGIDPKWLK